MNKKVDLKSALAKVKEVSESVASETNKAVEAAKPKVKQAIETSKPVVEKAIKKTGDTAIAVKDKSVDLAIKGKQEIVSKIDQNGNGEIDIDDIIILGLKIPGVKVDRSDFLRKELLKLYPQDVIEKAVNENPAKAGINKEDIDNIADEVIKSERNIVSGISTVLGAPGGAAMLATIPADIAQYYGVMLRVVQKLMYLYGFPELDINANGQILDSATLNTVTLCLGVMYGVAGANNAVKAMAKALAVGVEKKLINAALTKGTIYPIVKSVATWFGKRMTKEVFAGFFKDAIPVVGGVVGGGITYVSFKPCCDHLKESLQDTLLSNPDHISNNEENIIEADIQNVKEED